MIVDPEVTTARAVRNAARTRLASSLAQAKVQLTPGALAGNAVDSAKSAVETVATSQLAAARAHPARAAAIVAVLGAVLFRKRLYTLIASRPDATDTDDAS